LGKDYIRFYSILAAGLTAAGLAQYNAVFRGARRLIEGYRAVVTLDIFTAFSSGAMNLAVLALSLHLRFRSAASARALVAEDRGAYDAFWAVCLKDGDAAAALQRMEALVLGRWGRQRPELLRHRAGRADPPAPIDSLEQLFAQAAVLLVFLRAKARGWALRSRGRFPVLQLHGADAASGGGVLGGLCLSGGRTSPRIRAWLSGSSGPESSRLRYDPRPRQIAKECRIAPGSRRRYPRRVLGASWSAQLSKPVTAPEQSPLSAQRDAPLRIQRAELRPSPRHPHPLCAGAPWCSTSRPRSWLASR
jgi:hypothetical protein